jgi:1-aminocyclopropane-1-carboxylate synthase 1/2/6
MVSRVAARLVAGTPVIAAAHFRAEADPYHPAGNPGGYVNLGTAESRLMWDVLAPRLAAARPRTEADVRYQHLHGTDRLRGAAAALLSRTWRTPVDAADLVVAGGATAALDIIATVLCDPGEAIAVPAPYYSGLDTDLAGRSGARLVPVPMTGPGGRLDPAELDRALHRLRRDRVPVRAVAVTSPSNPQGQVHGVATLRGLLRVAAGHDLDVIADEIYAHSVFGRQRFASVRDPAVRAGLPRGADPDRVHVVWGFAKDFGLPGLKVGVLHTTGAAVRAAARELAYFAPVSTDTQALLADLLADTAWVRRFLAGSAGRLAASVRAAGDLLDRAGIGYLPPSAGFSLWLDLRAHLAEPTEGGERLLWERLFTGARLNILPGAVFGASEPGWFRLCHAVDAALVREGVARLAGALGAARPGRAA